MLITNLLKYPFLFFTIVIHWQPPITVIMRVTRWIKAQHKQLYRRRVNINITNAAQFHSHKHFTIMVTHMTF